MESETLLVGTSSPVGKLGSAIAHAVYEGKPVSLRAIGAGSIGQAMKGAAVAHTYVAERGGDLLLRPGFTDVTMPDKVVTAMTFDVVVL